MYIILVLIVMHRQPHGRLIILTAAWYYITDSSYNYLYVAMRLGFHHCQSSAVNMC